MENKNIKKCGLIVSDKGIEVDSTSFRIFDLAYDVEVKKVDDMFIITGSKAKYVFHMYDNYKADDISKIADTHIMYKKKYIWFGDIKPYITGYCELKEREPFKITTNNVVIYE